MVSMRGLVLLLASAHGFAPSLPARARTVLRSTEETAEEYVGYKDPTTLSFRETK